MGESTSIIYDLSNRDTKRKLMEHVGALSGFYEIDIQPKRATRRLRANKWYFASIVKAFVDYLNADGSRHFTTDMAHDALKLALIPVQVYDPRTGEVIAQVPGRTRSMTIEQFYVYCERARALLLEEYGVITLEPEDVGLERRGITSPQPKGLAAV